MRFPKLSFRAEILLHEQCYQSILSIWYRSYSWRLRWLHGVSRLTPMYVRINVLLTIV